jgi:hypothetical protein
MHFSIKSSGADENCTLRILAKNMQYNKDSIRQRQLEPLQALTDFFSRPCSPENFPTDWPFFFQRNWRLVTAGREGESCTNCHKQKSDRNQTKRLCAAAMTGNRVPSLPKSQAREFQATVSPFCPSGAHNQIYRSNDPLTWPPAVTPLCSKVVVSSTWLAWPDAVFCLVTYVTLAWGASTGIREKKKKKAL